MELVSGENSSLEREQFALTQNSTGLTCIRYKNEIILVPDAVNENEFLLARSQLPSVKYVHAVDYKSMIGGYRTLLVMNSVNPLLIPLRYLSHV